jgi:hypothetical protein
LLVAANRDLADDLSGIGNLRQYKLAAAGGEANQEDGKSSPHGCGSRVGHAVSRVDVMPTG